MPDRYRGRLILVGGNYAGSGDDPRIPGNVTIPGVVLQALIAGTVLSGLPVQETTTSTVAASCGIVGGLAVLVVLCIDRFSLIAPGLAVIATASLAWAWWLFLGHQVMTPAVTPLVMMAIGSTVAAGIRGWLPDFPPGYSMGRLVRPSASSIRPAMGA